MCKYRESSFAGDSPNLKTQLFQKQVFLSTGLKVFHLGDATLGTVGGGGCSQTKKCEIFVNRSFADSWTLPTMAHTFLHRRVALSKSVVECNDETNLLVVTGSWESFDTN